MGIDFGGNTDVYSVIRVGSGYTTSPRARRSALPSYSSEGKYIAYCSGDNGSLSGLIEIWVMEANGASIARSPTSADA